MYRIIPYTTLAALCLLIDICLSQYLQIEIIVCGRVIACIMLYESSHALIALAVLLTSLQAVLFSSSMLLNIGFLVPLAFILDQYKMHVTRGFWLKYLFFFVLVLFQIYVFTGTSTLFTSDRAFLCQMSICSIIIYSLLTYFERG